MDNIAKVIKQWEAERTGVYDGLQTLITGLQNFHIQSSKYVCYGAGTRAAGTLLNVIGANGGYEMTEVGGLFLEVAGSVTVTLTQLVQEHEDYKALAKSERLLDDHQNTHEVLKTALLEIHCVLPNLNYKQIYCIPDPKKARDDISDEMKKTLCLYYAIHPREAEETPGNNGDNGDNGNKAKETPGNNGDNGDNGNKAKETPGNNGDNGNKAKKTPGNNGDNGNKAKETPGNNGNKGKETLANNGDSGNSGDKSSDVDNKVDGREKQDQKENSAKEKISSNIDKAKTILTAISGIITRDVPPFFQSWETMNGRKVPETVNRLRHLKIDLKRQQDELMSQLEKLFRTEEFQRAKKTAQV